MQRTTNYNFNKPDYTDFADIQDINDNMDAIDAELAAPTGDLANATIKSSTASTASYPVPAANDTMKVMLGKIIKFCADIVKVFTGATSTRAGAKGLVPAPAANQHTRFLRADGTWREPVNGAGTTTAGDVLDARMGKTLNDKINTLNDSFTRSFTSGICGFGVLEKSGNVCILQYPIADFDPNGTAVPEGLRPKFDKGSWGTVLVTNNYTHQYVLHVENNGRVSLQKDGNNVTAVVSGVRGQVSWII